MVAIVGRPNVGKSTLVNALVGRKVTIVTAKPQTTRHRILGVVNRPDAQLVLVDTPGLHESTRRVMNQYMNRVAISSSQDADVILFVIEAMQFTDEDRWVWERVRGLKQPLFLVVNKVDRVYPKDQLLPFLEELTERVPASGIVPVSALERDNLDRLVDLVGSRLPAAPPLFAADVLTDRDEPFHAAEIVREKLTLKLREELPYGINVQIERFAEGGRPTHDQRGDLGRARRAKGHRDRPGRGAAEGDRAPGAHRTQRSVAAFGASGAVGQGQGKLGGQ